MAFRPPSPEQRERLKEQQREARAKRKEAMAADPRVQAMKEAQKERRRAVGEAAKARRKQATEERKQRERDAKAEQRSQQRAALGRRVGRATIGVEGERRSIRLCFGSTLQARTLQRVFLPGGT